MRKKTYFRKFEHHQFIYTWKKCSREQTILVCIQWLWYHFSNIQYGQSKCHKSFYEKWYTKQACGAFQRKNWLQYDYWHRRIHLIYLNGGKKNSMSINCVEVDDVRADYIFLDEIEEIDLECESPECVPAQEGLVMLQPDLQKNWTNRWKFLSTIHVASC